jgi:ABC-type polar amino acid transport system ATPase subunit
MQTARRTWIRNLRQYAITQAVVTHNLTLVRSLADYLLEGAF